MQITTRYVKYKFLQIIGKWVEIIKNLFKLVNGILRLPNLSYC